MLGRERSRSAPVGVDLWSAGSVLRPPVGPRWCCSAAQPELVDAVERGDEFGCPGPVGGEPAGGPSAGASDAGGGVEEAVAEPFRFGGGEVAVEREQAGPGEQVVRAEHEMEPGVVDLE